jgi:hypothetical protein
LVIFVEGLRILPSPCEAAVAFVRLPLNQEEEAMNPINLSIKAALLSGLFLAFAPGVVIGAEIAKKGSTSYTTHFVFHPKSSIDIPGVGKATALEAVGPTENTKGDAMLDKMKAKCAAVSVESGAKKWIDGACALTDNDGDVVFSTFDTRDLDKSQPKMDCGTHIVTGGTGKYKGITGSEPFACISKPTPAGEPEGSFAIDIPHNTTWEIKG